MKFPKTFMPNKDLEKKTEEFKEGHREVTPEELMENNWQILHGHATIQQRIENIENITSKIINDTIKNELAWKEHDMDDPRFSKCYKAKVVIQDYKQEPIIVQVLLRIDETKKLGKYVYLYLGNEKGLYLNSYTDHQTINQLLTEYFNKK